MTPLLGKILGRTTGGFVAEARRRGVKSRVARFLEAAAREIAPDDQCQVLDSRELFEKAAMHSIQKDVGNLALSFSLVDSLASAVETLDLARVSDVPDPFRRVWVSNEAGVRKRGVVLTIRDGEIAVFCPPGKDAFSKTGKLLSVGYRGFESAVEYDLVIDDVVRLPGALVLHLTRAGSGGAIGRDNRRFPVALSGRIQLIDDDDLLEGNNEFQPCRVHDLSSGGLHISCASPYEEGQVARIEYQMPDGHPTALFEARVIIRWARDADDGEASLGLEYDGLGSESTDRLVMYLQTLKPAE